MKNSSSQNNRDRSPSPYNPDKYQIKPTNRWLNPRAPQENLEKNEISSPKKSPKNHIDDLYSSVQDNIQQIKMKNQKYSRETITSRDSVDLESYKQYKSKLIREFERDKDSKIRSKSFDKSSTSPTDPFEPQLTDKYTLREAEVQGILKSPNTKRCPKMPVFEQSDAFFKETDNQKEPTNKRQQSPSAEKRVRINDMVKVREELKSKANLEIIQEKNSGKKMREDEHHSVQMDIPDHSYPNNNMNKLQRIKSDPFIRSDPYKGLKDTSINTGISYTINPREKTINLDESSQLYSNYRKDETLAFDKSDIKIGFMQDRYLKNKESTPQVSEQEYYKALGKCARLEKEKQNLYEDNMVLRRELDLARQKRGHHDHSQVYEDLENVKKMNDDLVEELFQLKLQLKRENGLNKLKRSKSRDQIYVSNNGVVSPFSPSEYFTSRRDTPQITSISKEQSKKIKFAESVVQMVSGLTRNNKEVQLKQAWKLLKQVITEYFEMKHNLENSHFSPQKIDKYHAKNLPTAMKNDFYGDLTKNKQLEGAKSDRFVISSSSNDNFLGRRQPNYPS